MHGYSRVWWIEECVSVVRVCCGTKWLLSDHEYIIILAFLLHRHFSIEASNTNTSCDYLPVPCRKVSRMTCFQSVLCCTMTFFEIIVYQLNIVLRITKFNTSKKYYNKKKLKNQRRSWDLKF